MPISLNKWNHLNRYERLYLQPIMDIYDQIEVMEEDVVIIANEYQLSTSAKLFTHSDPCIARLLGLSSR